MQPASQFNKSKYTPDGLRNRCKSCMKVERAGLKEHYRQWRGGRSEWYAQYRKDNYDPFKQAARNAVRRAVAKGTLVKQPCEKCGEVKSEAHHDDYSKPLEVRWLCDTHHKQHHHT